MPTNIDNNIDKEKLLKELGINKDDKVPGPDEELDEEGAQAEADDSHHEQFYLEYANTGQQGLLVPLQAQLIVGREKGDLIINHPSISNGHCTFFYSQDVLSIIDNGSRNGTFVGEDQINPGMMVILEAGDQIRIGQVEFNIARRDPDFVSQDQLGGNQSRAGIGTKTIMRIKSMFGFQIPKVEVAGGDYLKTSVFHKFVRLLRGGKVKEFRVDEKKRKAIKKQEQRKKDKEAKKKAKEDKKRRKKMGSKSTEKAIKVRYAIAGGIIRMVALLAELLLIFTIHSLAATIPFVSFILEDIIKLIQPYLKIVIERPEIKTYVAEYVGTIHLLLPYIVLFLLLRIIGTLILGVSPGQMLVGIKAGRNILWARIGGTVREIIGVVLGPFLIFDLPALMGVRTLKEWLSFSFITYESTFKKKFMTGLAVMGFLPIIVILPLLQDYRNLTGHEISNLKLKRVKFKKDPLMIMSNAFRLQTKTLLDNFVLLPRFDIIKEKKQRTVIPGLLIYDKVTKQKAKLRVYKSIPLYWFLKDANAVDPIMGLSFEKLSEGLKQPQSNWVTQRRSNKLNLRKYLGRNGALKKEIENYTLAAFKLGFTNIHEHTLSYGPFYRGYIDFRRSLIEEMAFKVPPLLTTIQLGNINFLVFKDNTEVDVIKMAKEMRWVLMPLGVQEGLTFELIWEKGKNYELSRIKFLTRFLSSTKWIFGLKNPYPIDTNDSASADIAHAIRFIDVYDSKIINENVKNLVFTQTTKYYKNLAQEALHLQDKEYQNAVLVSMNRIVNSIKTKKKPSPIYTNLMNQFKTLSVHLRDKDLKFYNQSIPLLPATAPPAAKPAKTGP